MVLLVYGMIVKLDLSNDSVNMAVGVLAAKELIGRVELRFCGYREVLKWLEM